MKIDQKKLDKEIKRIKTLKDCGFNCSLELDRLYTKRDNQVKGQGK